MDEQKQNARDGPLINLNPADGIENGIGDLKLSVPHAGESDSAFSSSLPEKWPRIDRVVKSAHCSECGWGIRPGSVTTINDGFCCLEGSSGLLAKVFCDLS